MPLNILLVDDSATVRGMIARALGVAGISLDNVRQAGNGLEAQAILKEEWIDLIITDIHMPGMDGLALLEWVRQDPVIGAIPVIMISTEGNAERLAEALRNGVTAYLRKPFSPEQVMSVVTEALGVQHA